MEMLLDYFNKVHPMSEELQEYLIEHVNVRTLSRKDKLLKAGHICRHIYFIESGMLRCYYMKGNTEVNSWFMKERDFAVSIESFYQQKESFESIQALEDCTVYYISFDELQVIYKTFPEFNYIIRELIQLYHRLWAQQLYGLRMQNSQERYDWLMQHHPDLLLRVPAKHVASYLRITEVTMSKLRGRGVRVTYISGAVVAMLNVNCLSQTVAVVYQQSGFITGQSRCSNGPFYYRIHS